MDLELENIDMQALIESGDKQSLRDFCEDHHPATVAEALQDLDLNEIWNVLHLISVEKRAGIFPHFDLDLQVDLAGGERRGEMAKLLEEMESDERADLVMELDEKVREEILPLVAKAEREDIRRLASYEEGTAGSVMTTDYAVLRPTQSVGEALKFIRTQAPGKETIYYIYVINERHQLQGLVSLRKLILSKPEQLVSEIMTDDIFAVDVNDDQEEVARKIEKFDLLAIPVVSGENVLVGIVTHDDALDILRQEQQEDVERLMAIAGSHSTREYMSTSVLNHFRNRVVWVLPLALFGLFSGMIIQENESLIQFLPLLAIFIPMLADTGGNTGSQSATLVVRALAMQEINAKDLFRVLFKEFRIAILLAVALSFVAFGRVMFFGSRDASKTVLADHLESDDFYLRAGEDTWLPLNFSIAHLEDRQRETVVGGEEIFLKRVAEDGTASYQGISEFRIPETESRLTLTFIGITVSLALALQVVSSTLLGAFLPLAASWFKVDPALVASPALTTCVDISGVFIFFTTCGLMFGPYLS